MENPNPTTTITLGARAWEVRPLTIGQLQEIMPAMSLAVVNGLSSKESFDASIKVIKAALSRDFADVTENDIRDIEVADFNQIIEAVKAIARLSGLKPVETAPGEAPAEAKTE